MPKSSEKQLFMKFGKSSNLRYQSLSDILGKKTTSRKELLNAFEGIITP